MGNLTLCVFYHNKFFFKIFLFYGYQLPRADLSNFQYLLDHTSYVTYNLQMVLILTISK